MVKRAAATGRYAETANLRDDLAEVFGTPDLNLIGVAISADSDDTDGMTRARVSDLVLR